MNPATPPLPRRLILAGACLGMVTLSFAVNIPAVCLTSIGRDFAFDAAGSGLFLSCSFWGLFVAILATGPLGDRWGPRVLLIASAGFQTAGFWTAGFAASRPILFLGAFLIGVGAGMSDALLTPVVCAVYPEARNRVSNLIHGFYPIGTLITIGLILVLFELHWSWRWIYRLIGLICLPYGAVFAILSLPGRMHSGTDRMGSRNLLRQVPFLLLLGGIFLAGVTELGPSQWLPAYLEKVSSVGKSQGALGLLVFGVTMATGRLMNSWVFHRWDPRRLFLIGGLLCGAGLILAAIPAPAVLTVVCLALVGLGVSVFWPTILACAGNRFPQAGASMYSALTAAGNFGGVAGPLLIGLVAQRCGLRWGMAVLSLAPILAIALLVRRNSTPHTT